MENAIGLILNVSKSIPSIMPFFSKDIKNGPQSIKSILAVSAILPTLQQLSWFLHLIKIPKNSFSFLTIRPLSGKIIPHREEDGNISNFSWLFNDKTPIM